MLKYMAQCCDSEGVPDSQKRVKLMTVGFGGAGKSTVLAAWQYTPTQTQRAAYAAGKLFGARWGPRIERTTSVLQTSVTRDGLNWVVYDMPGQCEYHATNSLFLSSHSVILLCVDLSLSATNDEEKRGSGSGSGSGGRPPHCLPLLLTRPPSTLPQPMSSPPLLPPHRQRPLLHGRCPLPPLRVRCRCR
jgi:hypothetical protein